MPQSYARMEGEFKPLMPAGKRILVRPHETPEYKGSIILPDSVKSVVPTAGVVLTLGWDFPENYPYIQEGDQILYSKYAGVEFKFDDGKRIMLIHEDDVLGVMVRENVLMSEKV